MALAGTCRRNTSNIAYSAWVKGSILEMIRAGNGIDSSGTAIPEKVNAILTRMAIRL
ncbi:hypothetical protein D3C72_2350260 [compost metagenome]